MRITSGKDRAAPSPAGSRTLTDAPVCATEASPRDRTIAFFRNSTSVTPSTFYGGYRLKPTVNLSIRWNYGSGFPIPGFLQKSGSLYNLTNVRNQLRLSAYSRIDFRENKLWTGDKWKLTLYGEVINLTNRTNCLFDSFNVYNIRTNQAFVTLDSMFPVLPSVGIVFER